MQSLLDKVKVTTATNQLTAGFKTLLILAEAENQLTGEEASAIKAGTVIQMADVVDGTATNLDSQYIKVRAEKGTTNVYIEAALTQGVIVSVSLPQGYTLGKALMTLPAHSEV